VRFRDGGLDLSHDEQALRDAVAQTAEKSFRPLADAWGERDELNWELARALGREGLFPRLVPRAYGGSLEGPFRSVTLCLIREELARTCAPAEELFAIQGLGSHPILLAGTEAQKARWLPSLASGESVPAFALTEPGAGSDAAAIATRAELRGDYWALTGEKHFISNAPVASLYVVFARTGSAPGTKGLSAFVVPKDAPGLTGAPMHIGRAPDCELVLKDSRVSRRHARLQARGGVLVLTDLGSTNGTRVNGHRITEMVLGAGDRIHVGETTIVVDGSGVPARP